LLPSALAMMFLVQWWLAPAGRSVTLVGAAVIAVCPALYATLTMAFALAI
jgi:magnesium-transporting ATPase (P-type)